VNAQVFGSINGSSAIVIFGTKASINYQKIQPPAELEHMTESLKRNNIPWNN
jgi:hypothetical protein